MTGEEAITYIEQYTWSTTRVGLDRTRHLLKELGDPQKQLKFIHVAGSNGKGSTCAMLESALRTAGYKTGFYTSPYIQDFRERIQVAGQYISPEALGRITERVRGIADSMEDHPSQFELVTAIGMVYFLEEHCDIVILEVGLGGEMDSTNVIDAPEVAVLTNIGLEHTEYLGDTTAKIARTKAGIVKTGCDCVCYGIDEEARSAVEEICAQRHVSLHFADFSLLKSWDCTLTGQDLAYKGKNYHLGMIGLHQTRNAAVVLETIQALRRRGWNISEDALCEGLENAAYPARMEVLGHYPDFILDGGHNPQCAQALRTSLDSLLPDRKIVFLMGVLADKNCDAMLHEILPIASSVYCLTPDSARAMTAEALAQRIESQGVEAHVCRDIPGAILEALLAAGEDGVLVAFGSLYLAGDIRTAYPAAFRKYVRKRSIRARGSIDPALRKIYSAQIVEKVATLEIFRRARNIMLYSAVRAEVNVNALSEHGTSEQTFVYPLCINGSEMVALEPKLGWESGSYGISEPVYDKSLVMNPEDIDLIVCPCTSFDEELNRMGMGAGYYDRFLNQCTNAHIIAVSFEAQKFPHLPAAPWDKPMEWVVTEERIYS